MVHFFLLSFATLPKTHSLIHKLIRFQGNVIHIVSVNEQATDLFTSMAKYSDTLANISQFDPFIGTVFAIALVTATTPLPDVYIHNAFGQTRKSRDFPQISLLSYTIGGALLYALFQYLQKLVLFVRERDVSHLLVHSSV